jgi:hypothetical protein
MTSESFDEVKTLTDSLEDPTVTLPDLFLTLTSGDETKMNSWLKRHNFNFAVKNSVIEMNNKVEIKIMPKTHVYRTLMEPPADVPIYNPI